jgi:hypothetical protein
LPLGASYRCAILPINTGESTHGHHSNRRRSDYRCVGNRACLSIELFHPILFPKPRTVALAPAAWFYLGFGGLSCCSSWELAFCFWAWPYLGVNFRHLEDHDFACPRSSGEWCFPIVVCTFRRTSKNPTTRRGLRMVRAQKVRSPTVCSGLLPQRGGPASRAFCEAVQPSFR